MKDKTKHVRLLRNDKKYVEQDDKFKKQKIAYLEKLKMDEEYSDPVFDGLIDVIVDPKDELELQYCESMLRFRDETRKVKLCCLTGDVKKIDLDDSYVIKTISDCIKSMSIHEVTREAYDKINAVDGARLTYEILVLSACDKDNFFNRLVVESGFDSTDVDDLELFNFFYSMFFAFFKSVDTTSVMNMNSFDDVLKHEIDFAERFHNEYLAGLSSSCTVDETYKENNLQKSLK